MVVKKKHGKSSPFKTSNDKEMEKKKKFWKIFENFFGKDFCVTRKRNKKLVKKYQKQKVVKCQLFLIFTCFLRKHALWSGTIIYGNFKMSGTSFRVFCKWFHMWRHDTLTRLFPNIERLHIKTLYTMKHVNIRLSRWL